MARTKDGWIKLFSSVLEKDFTLAEFKVWIGLLLLANPGKDRGIVDLPTRELAKRLKVGRRQLMLARNKFVREGRVELLSIPGRTHPIQAIKILNYGACQHGKIGALGEPNYGILGEPNYEKIGARSAKKGSPRIPNSERLAPVAPRKVPLGYQTMPRNEAGKEDKEDIYKEDKEVALKKKYGEFTNVFLTDQQYQKLKDKFGDDVSTKIEDLSVAIASKGYKYKDHYATILNWSRRYPEKARPKEAKDEPDSWDT